MKQMCQENHMVPFRRAINPFRIFAALESSSRQLALHLATYNYELSYLLVLPYSSRDTPGGKPVNDRINSGSMCLESHSHEDPLLAARLNYKAVFTTAYSTCNIEDNLPLSKPKDSHRSQNINSKPSSSKPAENQRFTNHNDLHNQNHPSPQRKAPRQRRPPRHRIHHRRNRRTRRQSRQNRQLH